MTGERKREQILDASVQVFGTGGAAAVTHRAVARVARVPLGSTTYYFTDRNDLLLQTMAHARRTEAARLAAIVEALHGELTVERSVEVLTEMFFDKTVADPLYDLALFEMFMEATRNITVRNEARGWSTMIGALVDRVLPASEPTVPRATVVQIVACLIDGLMLEAVSNGQLSVADLAERLQTVVERLCLRL
ncbi:MULTISPECIES: TetR/AcrR family transcriptional regulator [unclassified Cryobacterium]|uniref:TetR/AcrR family transcriptional regulator n=1 Tax=unclassified Cryobacterium TaxID=2649013 RepID=UPI002B23929B|nr:MULTISPECIES: TetR family transcriptional regulator [unclassified Cryobacterium]MEB0000306.1 TetR family transcriptional regulator [Cryobacterium sp. RTS3]MEB0267372.1 TetR family transcriptional regulator [Cryobacterium sp. 10I5]MEB0276306.1 TetR family transcriptional regulator [Cryobacterium sp. 5B3]